MGLGPAGRLADAGCQPTTGASCSAGTGGSDAAGDDAVLVFRHGFRVQGIGAIGHRDGTVDGRLRRRIGFAAVACAPCTGRHPIRRRHRDVRPARQRRAARLDHRDLSDKVRRRDRAGHPGRPCPRHALRLEHCRAVRHVQRRLSGPRLAPVAPDPIVNTHRHFATATHSLNGALP